MKIWSLILLASLALVASCKKPECPACPKTGDCPAVPTADAANPDEATVEFAYVKEEKTGNQALVGVRPDGKAIVIYLDPAKTRVVVDGKEGTLGETLLFGPGGGGCPCQQPRCWPYCRPAGDILTNPDILNPGGTGTGSGTAPTQPVPGGGSATGATQPPPN